MYKNRKPTTDTDSASILADFRRRFADELRSVGTDRIRVVIPGDVPGDYHVFVCDDAEEAAACLHRHWWGGQERTP